MFPGQRFSALKGWGTTGADLEAMRGVENIAVLDTVGCIEEVFARTKILLVPSLWYEGFGLVAMEAMLRGIPVIASGTGGLAEAKQGTGYVVPVRRIDRYTGAFDENHMPVPESVSQDMEPWRRALAALLGDRAAYDAEAEASRAAGLKFVSGLRASEFEEMLAGLRG
jgi:glycosyltransferase involved in cell wall biosynthesis